MKLTCCDIYKIAPMDDFLTIYGTTQWLGAEQIIAALLICFVLTSVVATVYRWTFQSLSYSRSFVHTMILSSMVVAIIIMTVGNSLARGLGILGSLAIVRFRTPVRDTRDMTFLFAMPWDRHRLRVRRVWSGRDRRVDVLRRGDVAALVAVCVAAAA